MGSDSHGIGMKVLKNSVLEKLAILVKNIDLIY